MELEVHPHQTSWRVTTPDTLFGRGPERTYDPGVVESDDSNNVNALFLDSA
jgi:hypothetical protein